MLLKEVVKGVMLNTTLAAEAKWSQSTCRVFLHPKISLSTVKVY